MPINIEHVEQETMDMINNEIKVYSPKWFCDKLTGTGKKAGLLNINRNPINTMYKTIDNARAIATMNIKRYNKTKNGNIEITEIPTYLLHFNSWVYMNQYIPYNINDYVDIATKNDTTLKMYIMPYAMTLTSEPEKPAISDVLVAYQVFILIQHDSTCESYEYAPDLRYACQASTNKFLTHISMKPNDILDQLTKNLTANNYIVDIQATMDYFQNYVLADHIGLCARTWNVYTSHMVCSFIENAVNMKGKSVYINGESILVDDTNITYQLTDILRYLETRATPTSDYTKIYDSIHKLIDPDQALYICKNNMNLLLVHTLGDLAEKKHLLPCIPTPIVPLSDPLFSPEQRLAIQDTSPLTLIPAGAGTGKSTVILGRLEFMENCGIDPKDIMVLSFTNIAADNIKAKQPNVKSYTIAFMLHTLYSANYNHGLSSIDTIINSISIYFPNDPFAKELNKLIKSINPNGKGRNKDKSSFTKLNNFIGDNMDKTLKVLDAIKQTSLELEQIICYQNIETMTIPKELSASHIIIDEVQDTSVFEFIYMLKYADVGLKSLFMVGDGSQTLYEFRASNPKALNALESSGVFANHTLTTNYRSNQEILDFANVALTNIEANQFAKIQLQANSRSKITSKSFQDKVHLNYHHVAKVKDFDEDWSSWFALEIVPYIDDKLAKGEQIAFIAHSRSHVGLIEESLIKHYPTQTINNLVPKRVFNSTVFSKYILTYWGEAKLLPTKGIVNSIDTSIMNHLDMLVDNSKSIPFATQMLTEYKIKNRETITNWENQVIAGRMPKDELFDHIRELMLDYEISTNAIRQSLLAQKNAKTKDENLNGNFILSTIHSIKGLEFDNVVILHRNTSAMVEADKRMYYVAFTRAKKTELIVSFGTDISPKIKDDYALVIELLDAKSNLKGNGVAVA